MTICIAGKNKIAVEALQYLKMNYNDYRIIACRNSNDDGINAWQPSLQFYCVKNEIPLVLLKDLYEIENLLFISLEFDKIVKPEKFKSKRMFNIHFSKLPAYKGMFTSVMPLLKGDNESGVTLHHIDKGIDTGAIVDQIVFPISLEDTSKDLYDHYLANGFKLFQKNISLLINDKVSSCPQAIVNSSYYSKSSLNFSNIKIDLNKTAFEIHNQVRAFSFKDYQLPSIFEYYIYKSEILFRNAMDKPGTIAFINEAYLVLNTVDYQVKVFIDKQKELITAAEVGDIEAFNKLKLLGYPVEIRTKQGWDALIISCYNNQKDFVKHLLEQGWDVNTCNYKGTTALMYAMTSASKDAKLETLELLADNADWSKRDDNDKDIFTYAAEYGNETVINFIRKFKK